MAYALTQVTADNGDRIYVMPGHAEEVAEEGGIDFDTSDVQVIGLGLGRNRPTFTLVDDVDASIEVNADDVSLENAIIDMTGIDDIVGGYHSNYSNQQHDSRSDNDIL